MASVRWRMRLTAHAASVHVVRIPSEMGDDVECVNGWAGFAQVFHCVVLPSPGNRTVPISESRDSGIPAIVRNDSVEPGWDVDERSVIPLRSSPR